METATDYEWDVIAHGPNGPVPTGVLAGGLAEGRALDRFAVHREMGTKPRLLRRTVNVTVGEWEDVTPDTA